MDDELVFARESLIANFHMATLLWSMHWKETEVHYRKSPMNPDYKQFSALENGGIGRYFTARVNGQIVGHLFFIVHINRHTQTKTAVEDFFFFMPEHRKGMNAIKLLRFAVESLKAEGCEQVGMSSKLTGTKDIAPLLKRVGFRHVANFYVI